MIFGNAGIVTVIITATSSFVTSRGYNLPVNIIFLIIGIFAIYKLNTRTTFVRKWETYIENKLLKLPTFEEDTTEDLLHFLEGYGLVRERIGENSSLIGNSLLESKLTEKGLLVLGIERSGNWIPIPKPTETIEMNDRLVVYGPFSVLKTIFN